VLLRVCQSYQSLLDWANSQRTDFRHLVGGLCSSITTRDRTSAENDLKIMAVKQGCLFF